MAPLADVAPAVVTKKGVLLDDRLEHDIAIAQHHYVPFGLVAEEIKNSQLLHPARDEGQCRLTVLDAEVERLIAAGERPHLVIFEPVVPKDRLDDLGDGL